MQVEKDIKIKLDKKEVELTRELVQLGLQRLEEVDKESWGEQYHIVKDYGEDFLKKTSL